MTKVVNKTELAEIVGIKNLRRLTLEQIEERLLKQCWVLKKVEKVGRSKMYTIEYEEQDFSINNYVEDEFNVRDGGKFMEHTSERVKSIKEERPMSAKQISEKIGMTRQTSYNYDRKLEEKGIIQKSKNCYYLVKDKKTGEVAITTEEAYMNFWSINKASKKELSDLYKRLEAGEITPKDYDFLTDAVKDKMKSDYYYYEVSKWIIDESNTTYQVIKEFLI